MALEEGWLIEYGLGPTHASRLDSRDFDGEAFYQGGEQDEGHAGRVLQVRDHGAAQPVRPQVAVHVVLCGARVGGVDEWFWFDMSATRATRRKAVDRWIDRGRGRGRAIGRARACLCLPSCWIVCRWPGWQRLMSVLLMKRHISRMLCGQGGVGVG